jgi:hypothetical protein
MKYYCPALNWSFDSDKLAYTLIGCGLKVYKLGMAVMIYE